MKSLVVGVRPVSRDWDGASLRRLSRSDASYSRIYDRYGVRLLELNVRAFLGLQGRKSVNAELRRTIADQPSMFLAYNNGIVATVDDLEIVNDRAGRPSIKSLKGLQIVNGGHPP
jgi:hypothetical protein